MTQVIPRFGYRVRIGAASEVGVRREVLQDRFLLAPALGVVAIADGMGGMPCGDLAARTALEEVAVAMSTETTQRVAEQYVASPDLETRRMVLKRLVRVIERANLRVRQLGEGQEQSCQLGTTLDLAWLLRDEVFLAHVGDSRVYVLRTNAVMQVTEDHSEAAKAPGASDPTRSRGYVISRLVNAVGLSERVSVDTLVLDLHRGDRLVLVTDGVWGAFSDEAQLEHLVRGSLAERAAQSLVEFAKGKSFDDRTAVIVEIFDRFVRHQSADSGTMAADIGPVAESALFFGMTWPKTLVVLSIAIQVEFAPNQELPHRLASDRVAYIVLDGIVRRGDGKRMGRGATLYGECLVGCEPRGPLYMCEECVRAIRIRRDDFNEICTADPLLAAELYRRLAELLGRQLAQ